jgi:hypothetical protein
MSSCYPSVLSTIGVILGIGEEHAESTFVGAVQKLDLSDTRISQMDVEMEYSFHMCSASDYRIDGQSCVVNRQIFADGCACFR